MASIRTKAEGDVFAPTDKLAELHTHLGGSVPAHVLWEIAHASGVAVPVSDYWEFAELIAVPEVGVDGLDGLDGVYKLCERIQSSPAAVEQAVHSMIGAGYRSQMITCVEIRFNPAKRNRNGETDLDHVILAACRAVDRASIEYPAVRAGIVLMADRTFDRRLNEIIIEKALRWKDRGVVGVDLGGPRPQPGAWPYEDLSEAFSAARKWGLGVTVHCGEEGNPEEIGTVVEELRPHRIGHGVLAAGVAELGRMLVREAVVLELCPTSNLRTGVFSTEEELSEAVLDLRSHGVQLTVSTDGPQMMRTGLREEYALLCRTGAFDEAACRAANALAHTVSFCPALRR